MLFGLGTGIILLARATTGGTDMLGNSLSHIIRHIPVGVLIQILDGTIVLIGVFAFSVENTLYAFISVYVMGKVIDKVVDSGKKAKIALIISKECDAISKDILIEMDRGVTSIGGTGEYSGKPSQNSCERLKSDSAQKFRGTTKPSDLSRITSPARHSSVSSTEGRQVCRSSKDKRARLTRNDASIATESAEASAKKTKAHQPRPKASPFPGQIGHGQTGHGQTGGYRYSIT